MQFLRAMRAVALVVLLAACATDTYGPETDHDEPADFEVDPDDTKADGLPASFDRNFVITDALLTDSLAMTTAEVLMPL